MCMSPPWKVNFSGFINIPLLYSVHRITCADPGCEDFVLPTCRFFETVGSGILTDNCPLDLASDGCPAPPPHPSHFPKGIQDWPRQLAYLSGGSKGAPLASPQLKIFSISCSFSEILAKSCCSPPGWCPLLRGILDPSLYLSIFH